jgi:hypothetical protein
LVSDFMEACRNFIRIFSTEKQPKIMKPIDAHSKSTVLNFRNLKKVFIS